MLFFLSGAPPFRDPVLTNTPLNDIILTKESTHSKVDAPETGICPYGHRLSRSQTGEAFLLLVIPIYVGK